MTKIRIVQADAFTEGLIAGNPARGCILPSLVDLNWLDLISNA